MPVPTSLWGLRKGLDLTLQGKYRGTGLQEDFNIGAKDRVFSGAKSPLVYLPKKAFSFRAIIPLITSPVFSA